MGRFAATLTTCAIFAGYSGSATHGDQRGDAAVVYLRLAQWPNQRSATAVLVHREDGPRGVTLYFLTSGLAADAARSNERADRGELESAHAELAVLKLVIADTPLTPTHVALERPVVGAAFTIIGHDADGIRVSTQQHVGRVDEGWVTGDAVLESSACAGAAAMSSAGLFGIVSNCSPDRPPRVMLLAAARGFLRRLIPGLDLGQRELMFGIGH